jgi:ATP-binding cassette subfamily B protein
MTDRTSQIEEAVQHENKPRLKYLIRLWLYVFSSVKGISCIYLGLYILLSFLRPLLAFMWGAYIERVELTGTGAGLAAAALLILAYFVINFLADLIQRYVQPMEQIERLDVVQANHQRELLHARMYKKLSSISPEYLEIAKINDTSDQVFKFVGADWEGMNSQVMMQTYVVIAKTVSVLTIAASLYIFNPWLCFLVLAAPIPSIFAMTAGQKLRFKFIKDNTKLQRRAAYFEELMRSPAAKELNTLGLYDFFYHKWKVLADEYTLKEQGLIKNQTLLDMTNNLLTSLANIGGNVFAIILMALGRLSLGSLGAVMSLVSTLVNDTRDLLTGVSTVFEKKNEAAQFFDLMELPEQEDKGEPCGAVTLLEAKQLQYRYPLTENYVLDGVDLTIRKGEKVALVGENGMGKTTFVKLVTGVLNPSGGDLLINGKPVEGLNPADRYRAISSVVQDPSHYNTFTVADNVFFGDTEKDRDEAAIDAALAFSGLGGDKDALLGKDFGGTDLSGGEWQKLAIARAAYRNRDCIILDEPTSNLDPLAETEIFKKYIALSGDKTVIFVTHRISVAALADRIIVFSGGKAIQDGAHGELIAQEGEYARLYREQAKWYNR